MGGWYLLVYSYSLNQRFYLLTYLLTTPAGIYIKISGVKTYKVHQLPSRPSCFLSIEVNHLNQPKSITSPSHNVHTDKIVRTLLSLQFDCAVPPRYV